MYAIFHVGAAGYAILMQIGKGKSVWKYAWAILAVYMVVAGAQAVMAGCFVGLMSVLLPLSNSFQLEGCLNFISICTDGS